MNYILLYFAIKYKGDWNKIFNALEAKERVDLKVIKNLEEEYKSKKWMTILDSKYPNQLKSSHKPPFLIFWEGDITLLRKKTICTSIDLLEQKDTENIKNNLKEISKSYVCVNSLSSKNDMNLLRVNQSIARSNIVVSSSGLNFNFGQKENDLVITELPDGCNQEKKKTNRLTAALSDSLILFNSSEKNHSNLVTNFLNLGKEVYCFPKEEKNYNNDLIKQGANLITSIKDVTKEISKGLERFN